MIFYEPDKIKEDIQTAILLKLEKIKKNQEIVNVQMSGECLGYGTCTPAGEGLKKLIYMDYIYQAARDIIEFNGSIEDWIEIIMDEGRKIND